MLKNYIFEAKKQNNYVSISFVVNVVNVVLIFCHSKIFLFFRHGFFAKLFFFASVKSLHLYIQKSIPMKQLILACMAAVLLSSCYVTTVTVGNGGKSTGKPCKGCYDGKKKQWYLFAGLVNLDKEAPKDALTRAGVNPNTAADYTMRITFSVGDYIICGLTGGIACPKTIRVSKQ